MKRFLFILLGITALNLFSQTAITASIPYQGYDETESHLGQGEYQIFIDNTNGVLDKPVILLDGFDPGDTRDINGIYNFLNYDDSNVGSQLRAEGFDLIILNFPTYIRESDESEVNGGADYIQRNAMVLIELINQINEEKIGTEELVIVGPSMGGLISRYALRYMEQQNLEHDTRLFVSWDVPHKGATVPISLQYLINYFAEVNGGNEEVQGIVNSVFNSPATKEMLIDHFKPHIESDSDYEQDPSILQPIGAADFRNDFQEELDEMGFPQQTRNISISNGSGIGSNTGSPGMEILNHTFDVPNVSSTTMEIILHFTPLAEQNIEVTKMITRFLGIPITTFSARSESFNYTNGLDSAPGGMYQVETLVGAVNNPLLVELIDNLAITDFCFIPVISSMAINEVDWHASISIPETHTTPFDAWHLPDVNERHVTPTSTNVAFVLAEIINETNGLTTSNFDAIFKLAKNPVSSEIKILSNRNFEKIQVSVLDITGKIVVAKQFNNTNNQLKLPINISNGIYFLKVAVNGGTYFKKIIVNN